MLQHDFRKFGSRAGNFLVRSRAKWTLGLLAAMCIVGFSARPAMADPFAGCGDYAYFVYYAPTEYGVGYDWNDANEDFEDSNGDSGLYWYTSDIEYDSGTGMWSVSVTWVLTAYDDMGGWTDRWYQTKTDDTLNGPWDYDDDFSFDHNLAATFTGDDKEADWTGNGTSDPDVNGRQWGEYEEASLGYGSDTD